MKNKEDRCNFCSPNLEEILKTVGYKMTTVELIKARDHIEAMGCVLNCGEVRKVCIPLMTLQLEVDRYSRNVKG